jgi:outer membrane protein OmpA-like peptidoglycan-associated protein
VKTEDFVVPVGTSVVVKGLEFDGPACSLTPAQERILRQVFNSLEEITENTVNDTNTARVAEFKKMKFEIRGYSTFAGNPKNDKALSEDCAKVVLSYLTRDGTPAWRLTAKGLGSKTPATRWSSTHKLMVEFTRTK